MFKFLFSYGNYVNLLCFRNIVLVNAAARRVDPIAGELYHLLLQLWNDCSHIGAPVTNAVDLHQIKEKIRKVGSSSALRDQLDQYLRVLREFDLKFAQGCCSNASSQPKDEDSSCLLTKSGEAGGGQYLLSYLAVFENLACAALDSIVLEKFGSKALRLFRFGLYRELRERPFYI